MLAPGGELRFASDDGDYAGAGAVHHRQRAAPSPGWPSAPADWRERPSRLARDPLRAESLERRRANRSISDGAVSDAHGGLRHGASTAPFCLLLFIDPAACRLDVGESRHRRHLLQPTARRDRRPIPTFKACLSRAADKADRLLNQSYQALQEAIREGRQGHGSGARCPARHADRRPEEMDRLSRRRIAASRTASPSAARPPAAIIPAASAP